MKITVEIAKKDNLWKNHPELNKALMKKLAANILARFEAFAQIKQFEISVLLTHEAEITELNNKFRNQKKATNVLSFPDIELHWQRLLEFRSNLDYMYLGDVAFCYQTISKEALEQCKSFKDHFTHLFVHSVLHLIGFDHIKELDAIVMEDMEIVVLRDFKIASPYGSSSSNK